MLIEFYDKLSQRLTGAGQWLAPVGLRLLLAYEFFSAGMQKFSAGTEAPSWFADKGFPFPFSVLSANFNWVMLTWSELIAAIALLLGLFTRFFAFVLIAVTTIAIVSTHWPESWANLGQLWEGYSVSRVVEDGEFRGNFRIPMLFLSMLLALLFLGGGKLSLDHALLNTTGRAGTTDLGIADRNAFAMAALVFGLITVYLIPSWGIILLLISAGLFIYARLKP